MTFVASVTSDLPPGRSPRRTARDPKAVLFLLSFLSAQHLNRLSDALFVWGRWAALKDGKEEPLWDSRAT